MTTKPRLMSAEELLELPRGQVRRELIGGELAKMAPAGYEYGRVTHEIALSLGMHVEVNKLASNPDTVRAPDVAFVGSGCGR